MNILVFSNCRLDPLLGSGRTRLAWSAGLRARGHRVEVVDSDGLLAGDESPRGRRLRLGRRAWRWVRKHDLRAYDLIEFYGAEFWLPTWWLSRQPRSRRPLLIAHTDGLEMLAADRARLTVGTPRGVRGVLTHWRERAEALAFSRPDGFITGCELDRRFLREHGLGPTGRMEVIPPGLEPLFLGRALAVGGRDQRVTFLGSWIARKGHAHVVAVMAPLLAENPALSLDLLGVGVSAETVLADFPAACRPRVAVYPRLSIPEVADKLSRAQVLLFPSEYEGFGLGLAEAMACGCAAVTTPTGFGAELRDGAQALICPFGDGAAMRGAVEQLLADRARRERIAEAGWRRVQELRWDSSVARLEQTYRRWLQTPAAAAQT